MRLRSSSFPLDARIAALVAIVAASAPPSVRAQAGGRGGPIDEATLVITKAGAPWGTETFRISSVGAEGSGQLRVTAQRIVGEQRFHTSLTTDSLGVPSSYELSLKEGPIEKLRLTVRAGPGRLASLASDQKRNESMKEYLLTPGATVILDDDLFHQYAVLALHRRSGSLKIVVPQSSREFSAVLSPAGTEPIEIGGRSVTATRYTLGEGRHFWLDSAGRLLRVSAPGGTVATREDLPR